MENHHPRESAPQRMSRSLLYLRQLILEGRYDIAGLSEKFAEAGFPSAYRTIHRRLEDLRALGDTFDFDAKRNRYYYPANFSPANMTLPAPAKKALAELRSVAKSVSPDLLAIIDSTLELYLPQITQTRLPITVQMDGVVLDEITRATYDLVVRAEAQRQVITFTYCDKKRNITTRQAEPYGFLISQAQIFVLARDRKKNKMRTFALEQMSELRLLPSTFVKPADFDIATYGRNSSSGLYDGPPIEVTVRFSERVAGYAKRTRLGKTAKAEETLLSGEVLLTLDVADANEMLRWTLSFGRDAEIVAPHYLRSSLAELASGIAAVHRLGVR